MSASFSPDADRVSVEGDRVVRPAYPWAPTIHALLRMKSTVERISRSLPYDLGA